MRLIVMGLIILSFNFFIMNDVNAEEVPNLPSDVYIDEGNGILMVKKPNDIPRPFIIKGVTWSPATKAPAEGPNPLNPTEMTQYGFFFDWAGRNPAGYEVLNYWLKNELLNHYLVDIPLIRQMNASTVRIYHSLGSSIEDYSRVAAEIKNVLDEFYRNGIMTIMTVAISKKDLDSQKYESVVSSYKDHPAVLMWAIGNEWNLNKFYDNNWSLDSAGAAVNLAAQRIKELDPHHPVCSILSDKFDNANDGGYPPTWTIPDIFPRCPNIDLWGLNLYRGNSFGNLFEQWKTTWQSIGQPAKPFYVSEFGIDSFYSTGYTADGSHPPKADDVTGYTDEQRQAYFDSALWNEIIGHLSMSSPGELCLGGLIHEFNDELWKVGSYHVGLGGLVDYNNPPDNHSYDDYNNEGFVLNGASPDSVMNEEHFGLMTAERTPKLAYNALKELFKPDLVITDIKFYRPRTEIEIIPKPTELVTCKAILKNQGSDSTGIFNVKWFLDGKQVGYGSHASLLPGQDSNDNVRYDWVPTSGTHVLKFVADCDNHVQESDEANNSITKTLNVQQQLLSLSVTVYEVPSWRLWWRRFYRPISAATVTLRQDLKVIKQATTDYRGRCNFNNIPAGTYQLSVSKPGYRPSTRIVKLNSNSNLSNVSFYLFKYFFSQE